MAERCISHATPVPLKVTPELRERVQTAWELASLLRRNRFAAGSLDLDFPEVKVWLDDQGRADRLEHVENDISHQLIEECMLAANEVVARELKNRNIPVIYRVHEEPDPDRLADFREMAASLRLSRGRHHPARVNFKSCSPPPRANRRNTPSSWPC